MVEFVDETEESIEGRERLDNLLKATTGFVAKRKRNFQVNRGGDLSFNVREIVRGSVVEALEIGLNPSVRRYYPPTIRIMIDREEYLELAKGLGELYETIRSEDGDKEEHVKIIADFSSQPNYTR